MDGTTHRRHNHNSSQNAVDLSYSGPSSPRLMRHRNRAVTSVAKGIKRHPVVSLAFDQYKKIGVFFTIISLCIVGSILNTQQPSSRTFEVSSSTTKARQKDGENRVLSPFQSHPPNITNMDIAKNRRHACINEIRSRQHDFFQPFLRNADHLLLVDPAYHSNVGDHMITVAELTLFQKTYNLSIDQCSYVQAHNFVPSCDERFDRSRVGNMADAANKKFQQNNLALWHGGGNFGNLWPTAQQARIRSLVPLLQGNYTIIGMPNSWYYTNDAIEKKDVQQIRTNILVGLGISAEATSTINDRHLATMVKSRIIWTWREHYSYDRAMQLLPYCSHQLLPDIAFQLGPYQPIRPVGTLPTQRLTDLVFLLRNDHESMHRALRNRNSIQSILETIPGAAHLSFIIVDWDDRLYRFASDNPKDFYFTDSSIQLLSLGRVLICDRLHAALLAYLTNLSFIYLDQVSGKISKTIQVAMESGPSCMSDSSLSNTEMNHEKDSVLWRRAENIPDAIGKAMEVLSIQQMQKSQFSTVARPFISAREERRNRLRHKAFLGG